MAEIEWTDEAKFWLQQIYDYIARDNEEAAWQVVLGIYERLQVLREFPECGHRYEKVSCIQCSRGRARMIRWSFHQSSSCWFQSQSQHLYYRRDAPPA